VNPSRSSIRMDPRLDATTRQKLDDLAQHFHQPRAAVLCHIMQWGLSHDYTEPRDQGELHGPVRHLNFFVDTELHQRVETAAAAAGMKMAPWLRHMVRKNTIADFPTSWHGERSEERPHDSRTYGTRFMLRLDEPSQTKLQELVKQFGVPKAEIIRQLLAQAKTEDFPKSWHMKATEHRAHQSRQNDRHIGHRE
jgi:predicted DNA-binding protein